MPQTQAISPGSTAINAVLLAVRQAADVLCDRWTLAVLLYAFSGVSKYNDFRSCTGMGSRQLTGRLRKLEEQGLLVRLPYSAQPARFSSHLSAMGQNLAGVGACMAQWNHRYASSVGEPRVEIAHLGCPCNKSAPVLMCVHCHAIVDARETRTIVRPASELQPLPAKQAIYRRTASSGRRDHAKLPLGECLEILGDKWTIEILVIMFLRIDGFVEIKKLLGISSNILSDRLTRLVEYGLLRRTDTAEAGRKGSYRMTEKGVAFYPILLAIQAWADACLPNRLRSPLPIEHTPCGQSLALEMACDACGSAISKEAFSFTIEHEIVETAKTKVSG